MSESLPPMQAYVALSPEDVQSGLDFLDLALGHVEGSEERRTHPLYPLWSALDALGRTAACMVVAPDSTNPFDPNGEQSATAVLQAMSATSPYVVQPISEATVWAAVEEHSVLEQLPAKAFARAVELLFEHVRREMPTSGGLAEKYKEFIEAVFTVYAGQIGDTLRKEKLL